MTMKISNAIADGIGGIRVSVHLKGAAPPAGPFRVNL